MALLPVGKKVNCDIENSDVLRHEVTVLSEGADAAR